ncbi:hypothetical protein V6N13_004082 [Hibiscus sabdariffa]|uniref:Uncharacterized protein n=1 Tax=Hibiscus sabdariffa TaxID=183260 RepID=A0ABR2RXE2_9ROSI
MNCLLYPWVTMSIAVSVASAAPKLKPVTVMLISSASTQTWIYIERATRNQLLFSHNKVGTTITYLVSGAGSVIRSCSSIKGVEEVPHNSDHLTIVNDISAEITM